VKGSRKIVCTLGVLLLVLTSQSPGAAPLAQPDEKHLIIPGNSIGPIKIGMSPSVVRSILSPGSRLPAPPPGYEQTIGVWSGPLGSFWVRFAEPGAVAIAIDKDTGYATAEGVHIGSTADEVRAAFGEPSNVAHKSSLKREDYDVMQYDSKGIDMFLRQDRVFRILVCPPMHEACGFLDF
jgi:hypothetical protein